MKAHQPPPRRGWALALVLPLAVLFAVSPCAAGLAGEAYFESISNTGSIPDNNVSALAQDSNGLIWVGTPAGLFRFDGYDFRRVDAVDGGGPAIGFIRTLLATADGRLWIGTDVDGLWLLEPDRHRPQAFRHDPQRSDSLSRGSIRALASTDEGGLWIGTDTGLNYWPGSGDRFEHFRHPLDDPDRARRDHVWALQTDAAGDLWIGSERGLSRLRRSDSRIEHLHGDDAASQALSTAGVTSLLRASDGLIWAGTVEGRLFRIDPATLRITELHGLEDPRAPTRSGRALVQARGDRIWMGGLSGIDVFDRESGQALTRHDHDPALHHGLASTEMRALLRDRAGQIWVGGYGGGLQRHDPHQEAIRVLRYRPDSAHGLSQGNVGSLLVLDDGRWLAGLRGNGIDIFDQATGRIGGWRPNAPGRPGIGDGVVDAMAQTADGSIWFGSGNWLYRAPADGSMPQRIPASDFAPDDEIRNMLVSADDQLWVGTNSGLWRAPGSGGRFEAVAIAEGGVLRTAVNALLQAPDGRVWVGTRFGLYTQAAGAHSLIRVETQPGASDPSHESVLALLLDSRQRLWIDTPRGLDRMLAFDGRQARFERVSERLQLGARPFGGNLLEDARGRIWSQAHMLDPETWQTYPLTRADGVNFGTPWFRSRARTADGRLLFGGSEGVLLIDPERFRPWDYQPPLVFTDLQVGGIRQVRDGDAALQIAADDVRLRAEFAALDFTYPERLRYRYRLEGYDKDWNETGAEHRLAVYTNLWPGRYTLRVRGSNRIGTFADTELSLPIEVLPAFWQTKSFALLLLLAGATGMGVVVRLRTAAMRVRAAALEQQVEQRTQELAEARDRAEAALASERATQEELVRADKMAALGQLVAGVAHEVNTPLGIALTASSHLAGTTAELRRLLQEPKIGRRALDAYLATAEEGSRLIHGNLERAAELIRSFKQVSVDRSSDNRREFRLDDYLGELLQSLQMLTRRLPIRLHASCAPDLILDSFPGALGQVLNNLTQNAVMHAFADGQEGEVRIDARPLDGKRVRLQVIDNGRGVAAEHLRQIFEPFFTTKRGQGGSGLGLHIVYNLVVQKLGGEIHLETPPGGGCAFVLDLPRKAPVHEDGGPGNPT